MQLVVTVWVLHVEYCDVKCLGDCQHGISIAPSYFVVQIVLQLQFLCSDVVLLADVFCGFLFFIFCFDSHF